jgi:hypothetical protein
MKIVLKLSILYVLIQFSGCYSGGGQSEITGVHYDETKNITTYIKIPFGNMEIPGKWKQGKMDYVSRSQYLISDDSEIIGVSISGERQYSFYNDSIKGKRFPKAHFEWESKYMKDTLNAKVSLLKIDSASGSILWEVELKEAKNLFFLYDKNERFYNIKYVVTKSKTESRGISLLHEIYAMNN